MKSYYKLGLGLAFINQSLFAFPLAQVSVLHLSSSYCNFAKTFGCKLSESHYHPHMKYFTLLFYKFSIVFTYAMFLSPLTILGSSILQPTWPENIYN